MPMNPNRTIEIWKYRYKKYTNVLVSTLRWLVTIITIKIQKIFNPQTQFIGVLLAEHFGDIVACEPLSEEIKKQYPNAKIYWIVRKPYRELLDYNSYIDTVIEEYSVFYSILLAKFNAFDVFFNCHLSGLRRYPYLQKTLQNPLAISKNILTNNYFDHGNILDVFAKVSGLPTVNTAPKIYIPPHVELSVNQLNLPERFVVIHCHSNYSPKDWQIYYWEKLVADLLSEFDYHVIEIGLRSTLNIYHSQYHNYCGKLSLLQTAELIKRSKYFIGIDSGPAHFANAVGTYGILLFGKLGDFEDYMPYSGTYQDKSNATLIVKKGYPCSELGYEEVWDVIKNEISYEKKRVLWK
ncbi:MAG: glycosyltransferase family 9 protein [Arcicella sp.]|nr:glycosyltransferase family 9 protein [Arcicella sp.]